MRRWLSLGLCAFMLSSCDRQAGPAGKAPALTDANFQQEVLQSAQPVLVDFWGEG